MSATLEVRELWVLFGGDGQEPRAGETTSRGYVTDQPTPPIPAGYRQGLIDVGFSVQAGECLAVLGSSGAGKSSLLRTLAGLQPAASGSIRVNGRDVYALSPELRGIVYLHQEPVLFPHLSVLENVMFPLLIRGVDKRDAERRACGKLDQLRVLDVMGNAPDALSGGQRHRVALARALCADPAVLLLDEPLSSLDPSVRREVRAALLTAREASGAAVILVTHDLDDAMAVGTHIAAIADGFTLTAPMPALEAVESPPSLEMARLLGVYAEIAGQVRETDGGRHFAWIGGVLPAPHCPAGPAVACVRAHQVDVLPVPAADQRPALLVLVRRDGARESELVLGGPGDRDARDRVTIRVPVATAARPGERVRLLLHGARLFTVAG